MGQPFSLLMATLGIDSLREPGGRRREQPRSYDEVLTATAMWDTDGAPGGLNHSVFPQYPLEAGWRAHGRVT
jgi:hypothetical protein